MAKSIVTTKDIDDYVDSHIKASLESDIKFNATDREILLVIIDYLIHTTDGVRKTAKRTGHSKTWVWQVLRFAPAKYDDKLARLVYHTMHSNVKTNKCSVHIGRSDMNKLFNARTKLNALKDEYKTVTKFRAKFLLWF